MPSHEIADVPGTPEATLGAALLAGLPAEAAAAPWRAECEAVVWLHRAGAAAAGAIPPSLGTERPLVVVGGLVRYRSTPVGGYDEVFGSLVLRTGVRPWGHVPFLAVDSEASLVGGRANWAMPKTLATFGGGPDTTFRATGTDGLRWQVAATARPRGPRLPMAFGAQARQQFPDGGVRASRLRGRGRMRPATVTVEVESEGPLATWLRPGRHLGAVLEHTTLHLGPPAPPPRP